MPHNSGNTIKPIRCISCGKIIAEGTMTVGNITILCRCGVSNRIEADIKPEGRRAREIVEVQAASGTVSTRTR